jgi:Iron-containing redox enzyme
MQTTAFVPTAPPEAPRSAPTGIRHILGQYESMDVAEHRLFVELAARAVDLRAMWALVHSFREGISRHLVRWLSGVLHRSPTAVQCILIGMLYDELGAGRPEDVHAELLDRWYRSLHPWRVEADADADALLAVGHTMGQRLEGLFGNADVNVALAAVMVAEVFAEKFDKCLMAQMRRTDALGEHDLEWLTLHCQVEEAHAAASVKLAGLVDAAGPFNEQLRIAAAGTWHAFTEYLDGVHALLSRNVWDALQD